MVHELKEPGAGAGEMILEFDPLNRDVCTLRNRTASIQRQTSVEPDRLTI